MTSVKAIYNDGRIKLLEPVPAAGKCNLIVIFLDESGKTDAVFKRNGGKKHAWPAGFFERTAGCLVDTPLCRPAPGKFERRKTIR